MKHPRPLREDIPDPSLKHGGIARGESMTGTVRWWKDDKGYGRINGDDGYVYFAHFAAIEGKGYRALTQGQRVSFEWQGNYVAFGRKAVDCVRLI